MCTISGTCGCNSTASGGTTLLAMLATGTWWLVRAVCNVLLAMLAALIIALRWATPRAWRLSVRVTRAGHRRWTTYRLSKATAPPAPAPAIEAPLMTLSDLLDKQPAEVVR
jgi:uncharacterized protein (TIGR03382 family)